MTRNDPGRRPIPARSLALTRRAVAWLAARGVMPDQVSRFGLAAGVWTKDFRRAHLMARRLEAGTVWLNTYRTLAFNSPFGGYKSSGIGRVNGTEAVNHYLQTKSVWCELGDEVRDPFAFKA